MGLSARKAFWWTFVGTLLVQAAWILVVPAFRGIDEFDHVYKAEAVSHGTFVGLGSAEEARGGLVEARDDVIAAAKRACRSRRYTQRYNCEPMESRGDSWSLVASAADTYNPVYYAVVGTIARPFHGVGVLFAVRAATAVVSALLLAGAATAATRWGAGSWGLLSLHVATTPVLLYSTAIASPNGIQYAGAALVWTSLLALAAGAPAVRRSLGGASVGTAAVLVTHSTGPMWLVLIGLVVMLVAPLSTWPALWRQQRRTTLAAVTAVVLLGLACLAWTRYSHANAIGAANPQVEPLRLGALVREQVSWLFQVVGAFPMRNEPAHPLVYALWLVAFGAVVVAFLRAATRRERRTYLVLVVLTLAVPTVLTLVSYSFTSFAWQGRYTLPLAVGLALLPGWDLTRRGVAVKRRTAWLLVAVTSLAHVTSVVTVAFSERGDYASPAPVFSFPGGIVLAGVLAAGSCLGVVQHLRASSRRAVGPSPVATPVG